MSNGTLPFTKEQGEMFIILCQKYQLQPAVATDIINDIARKKPTGITRDQLQRALVKIGWRIEKSGNGLNDFIINHKNERTRFRVIDDKIEISSDQIYGGSHWMGSSTFRLSDMSISEVRSGGPGSMIDGISINFNDHCYFMFHNIDRDKVAEEN